MSEQTGVKPKPNLAATALRFGAHAAWDGLTRPRARKPGDVPYTIEAVTKEWLTSALCHDAEDLRVVGFELGPRTSGSTVRRRIKLSYSRDPGNADLPTTVFAKSSPRFFNRLALGLTRTIENEALFYENIRPLVSLEAPRGYRSAYDLTSGRSIHLLEDLVATKGASFCSPRDDIDRGKAENIVEILAAFHGRFMKEPDLPRMFPWLPTYPEWFHLGYDSFGLRPFHDRAMLEAADVIPEAIRRRASEVWPAQIRSLASHDRLPKTLLHGDVHLGNWYITDKGQMGLCDWQCVSIGCWARDFAYAVGATLTVENRRAWERDLLRHYLVKLAAEAKIVIPFEEAWWLYRQQMPAALLMWTVTLVHSPLMPDMQPRDVSIEMIKRMTNAICDLNSLDV